jgi:hypothetical protein
LENKNYVVLYNPKTEKAAQHECDLPKISGNDGGAFEYRAVIECEQCAKKWYAFIWDQEDKYDGQLNKWKPLRWYNWRLHYIVATRKGK